MEVINIGDFKEELVKLCYTDCPACGTEISALLSELESMDTITCEHCNIEYKVE